MFRRNGFSPKAGIVLGLSVALLLGASLAVSAQQAGFRDGTLEVRLSEWSLGFDRAVVSKAELADSTTIGNELPIHVVNEGSFDHNLTLKIETSFDEFYIRSEVLAPGEETTFVVSLPTGEYELFCSIDGHADQGMSGMLVIEEGEEEGGIFENGEEDEEEENGGGYY